MTKERNVIFVVTIQNWIVIPVVTQPILSTQFFFYAIAQYFSVFIEDVKMAIQRFGRTNCGLKENFTEMIKFHWTTLE